MAMATDVSDFCLLLGADVRMFTGGGTWGGEDALQAGISSGQGLCNRTSTGRLALGDKR
jgi:hypothetical protein